MTKFKRSIVLAALAVGVVPFAQAQQSGSTGRILVTLVDSAGTPLPDTKVKLEKSGISAQQDAGNVAPQAFTPAVTVAEKATDKEGKVEFAGLAAGKYRLNATTAAGRAIEPVKVEAGKTIEKTLKLAK